MKLKPKSAMPNIQRATAGPKPIGIILVIWPTRKISPITKRPIANGLNRVGRGAGGRAAACTGGSGAAKGCWIGSLIGFVLLREDGEKTSVEGERARIPS